MKHTTASPVEATAPIPPPGTPDGSQDGYTQEQLDRLTATDSQLAWADLDHEDRLALIMETKDPSAWLAPEALATLVYFRPIPQVWARIRERFKRYKGNPYDLEKAVDAERAQTTAPVDPQPPARQRAQRLTAAQLEALTLPPLAFIVEDVLPAGSTLFTGRSKDGKSMAAYNLAVAVASGGKAFGRYQVLLGRVWYLALEDGERRSQARLRHQAALMGPLTPEAAARLEFTLWDAPRLGEGLEDDLGFP